MHADNALVDQGTHRHVFEAIGESLPKTNIVSALALVVEPINLVDIVCFVITAEKEELLRILHFIGEKKTDALDTLLSSVHIVTTMKGPQNTNPRNR